MLAAYAPAVAWAAVVLYVGGLRDLGPPSFLPDAPFDKVAHLIMYSVLGGLIGRGWLRSGRNTTRVWPIMIVLALAAFDEWHQVSIPGRTADPVDWAVDAVGALAAFGWVTRYARRSKRKVEYEP